MHAGIRLLDGSVGRYAATAEDIETDVRILQPLPRRSFNRKIFAWRQTKPDIVYILSKDILKHRRAQKEEADAWLAKGATWSDGLVRVAATGSTDSGVSWIVETDGKRIFHAGDLNNWYARFLTDGYHGGLVYSAETGTDVNPERKRSAF